jgi:hypothetical protein
VCVESDAINLSSESLHLAPFQADPATRAALRFKPGYEGARDNLGWIGMTFETSQNAAAAATTTANETGIL